ncbi:MAG: VIT1/CCC1 transporter family protein [Paracoccus sp. (in: a-proteobacteria)]|uniref:VIT1/CCC1 transporter family protein n=1 Tax=Paracoccus sp. TaxID=267 RepID=UPI0039E38B22
MDRTLRPAHPEMHFVNRMGWLRAAVLGANDGIVSVSSLMVGVAAAQPGRSAMLIAGAAGLAAGAMSMAAGEYVSVSSQRDTEKADIARERAELLEMPEEEEAELAAIFQSRGLSAGTAALVAHEMSRKDPLSAHMREELGLSEAMAANPLQAALTSAATFSGAAAVPLITAAMAPAGMVVPLVAAVTLVSLAVLGALGAHAGGAPKAAAARRVAFWGAIAMAVTAGVGRIFGIGL